MHRRTAHSTASIFAVLLTAVLVCCVVATTPAEAARSAKRDRPTTPLPKPAVRNVPSPIYGMTQDDVSNLSQIVDGSSHLSRMPTNRIVFDENVKATYYSSAVAKLRPVSYLMGELLDSAYVKQISTQGYHDRMASYLATLGSNVDIWEVGNEVNGEWLGTTSSVVAKISDAYDQTTAKGYATALTLYYNPNCWSRKSNEMFAWTQANVPARMKSGLDYVLVSYYEQDCENFRPTVAQWQQVFDRLHTMFPNSKLGFGETGTHPNSSLAYKQDTMRRYYGMPISTPGYVGGYFWWYANQDLLPWTTKPLWKTFDSEIRTY